MATPLLHPRTFAEVVDALNALPARFHLATEPPPGAVSLAALADPDVARGLIEQHAVVRRLGDVAWARAAQPGQVASSLTVQGIAMRLGGVALAGVVLERVLLLAAPENIYVGVQGPMFSVAITDAEVVTASGPDDLLPQWAEHWLDGHLRSLVDSIRRAQRVGEALLWGNIASAVAATYVVFDWWDPSCEGRRLAERTLELGAPRLAASASLVDLEVAGRVGLRSERTACCLMRLIPDARLCPTCPKTTEADRIANTAQHVHHLFAVRDGAVGPPPWATRP